MPSAAHSLDSHGTNQGQTLVFSNAGLLHGSHVCKSERRGWGRGSGGQDRLDVLNPGQSDRYLCFPGARSFCNGLGVGLDVCDSLFKLLLQEFFFFGVAFREH